MLGRTGNNLFQYAFGRVLSERHGVPLVMDGAWFNKAGWKSVSCLRRLPIQAELRRGLTLPARLLKKATGRHLLELLNLTHQVAEIPDDHSYNHAYLDAPPNCLIRGYFQSPLYFSGIESKLRRELDMSGLPWRTATLRLAERIESESSVAVHVRRSDYVGNPDVAVCGADYYKRAIRLLRERHENLVFHLFSDDPAWCSRQFAHDGVLIHSLPEAEGDPLHDLFLMSLAKRHIICNSTYSWWAAWLAGPSSQKVIMPDQWFASGITSPIGEKRVEGWEILNTIAPQ